MHEGVIRSSCFQGPHCFIALLSSEWVGRSEISRLVVSSSNLGDMDELFLFPALSDEGTLCWWMNTRFSLNFDLFHLLHSLHWIKTLDHFFIPDSHFAYFSPWLFFTKIFRWINLSSFPFVFLYHSSLNSRRSRPTFFIDQQEIHFRILEGSEI